MLDWATPTELKSGRLFSLRARGVLVRRHQCEWVLTGSLVSCFRAEKTWIRVQRVALSGRVWTPELRLITVAADSFTFSLARWMLDAKAVTL